MQTLDALVEFAGSGSFETVLRRKSGGDRIEVSLSTFPNGYLLICLFGLALLILT
jgi:hypothetical protein